MGIQAVEVHGCPHCGTPVEGPQGSFCCHGCEAASALVHSAGLDAWYATREKPGPRVRSVEPIAWSRVPRAVADETIKVRVTVHGPQIDVGQDTTFKGPGTEIEHHEEHEAPRHEAAEHGDDKPVENGTAPAIPAAAPTEHEGEQ